jgi:hypothetical protein
LQYTFLIVVADPPDSMQDPARIAYQMSQIQQMSLEWQTIVECMNTGQSEFDTSRINVRAQE